MTITKKSNWYKTLFLLFMFLLGYYEYYSIDSTFKNLAGMDSIVHNSVEKIHLLLLTFLSFFVFILSPNILKRENNKVVKFYVGFQFIFIAINFLHVLVSNYRAGTAIEYVSWFSPLCVFGAIYVLTYRMRNPNFQAWCFVILNLILVYGYYSFYQYIYILINTDEQVQLMSYYFSLYLLPLALCVNKRAIKYLLVIVLIVVATTAGKRTGAVALFLGIFTYLYIHLYSVPDAKKKKLLLVVFIVLLVCGYYAISFSLESSDLFLFQRLSSMGEDHGSGRTEWYGKVLSEIKNMDFTYYMFGHGYKGVLKYLHKGKGADTDILEVTYDYGVVGTILFWALLLSLISYVIYLTRKRSFYAAPFGMSVTIYVIGSTLSHIIVYPYFEIIFALTWGYIIACRRLEIEENCARSKEITPQRILVN